MKFAFHYLAVLNMADAFATFFGLQHAFISEMNPLMARLYQLNPLCFLFTKLSLSFLLYLFIYFKKLPVKRALKSVTYGAVSLYTGVFILHGLWIWSLT